MPDDAPLVHVEPPIPTATEIATVEHARAILRQHDAGNFRQSALMTERMLWNARLRGVAETRQAGLISTRIRFKPQKNNRDGRRAAKAFEEDWPLIAPAPMRKQMLKWGLFLGFTAGQRPFLAESPRTGRQLFMLRPYWPGFALWQQTRRVYEIAVEGGRVDVPSPSLGPTSSDRSSWVIAEPFGVNSYRDGIIHAAWRPWLGHEWAMRDQARSSEKHGVGIIKAFYPKGAKGPALERWLNGMRAGGSEGIYPCERDPDAPEGGYDAAPFEYSGSGFAAISDTMGSCAVALAILFLGHNLTTEIKNGGSYAAAGVADYIRDDKKNDDAEIEWAYIGPQLAEPWAIANYGDPELAPVAEYITDSPAVNLQRAQMIQALAYAAEKLRRDVPRVDLEALAEEFRLPMLDEKVAVAVVEDIEPTDPTDPADQLEPQTNNAEPSK